MVVAALLSTLPASTMEYQRQRVSWNHVVAKRKNIASQTTKSPSRAYPAARRDHQCPFAELKPCLTRIAVDARTRSHTDQRKSTMQLYAIDRLATKISHKKNPRDELGLLRLVQQGGTWDRTHTQRASDTMVMPTVSIAGLPILTSSTSFGYVQH